MAIDTRLKWTAVVLLMLSVAWWAGLQSGRLQATAARGPLVQPPAAPRDGSWEESLPRPAPPATFSRPQDAAAASPRPDTPSVPDAADLPNTSPLSPAVDSVRDRRRPSHAAVLASDVSLSRKMRDHGVPLKEFDEALFDESAIKVTYESCAASLSALARLCLCSFGLGAHLDDNDACR